METSIEYKGFTIEIHIDEYAGDPHKEFDNYSKAEVKAWERGEVYGWIVKEQGEHVDSCWGYYGDLEYCIQSAKDSIDYHSEEIKKADAIMHL